LQRSNIWSLGESDLVFDAHSAKVSPTSSGNKLKLPISDITVGGATREALLK
jgi:hypothetical protein